MIILVITGLNGPIPTEALAQIAELAPLATTTINGELSKDELKRLAREAEVALLERRTELAQRATEIDLKIDKKEPLTPAKPTKHGYYGRKDGYLNAVHGLGKRSRLAAPRRSVHNIRART